jgi:hypothetical protein
VVPKETKRRLKEWRKARKRDLESPPPDGVATWQRMDEAATEEDEIEAAAKAAAEREALRLPPPAPETPTPPPGVNLAPPGPPGQDWRSEVKQDLDDVPLLGFLADDEPPTPLLDPVRVPTDQIDPPMPDDHFGMGTGGSQDPRFAPVDEPRPLAVPDLEPRLEDLAPPTDAPVDRPAYEASPFPPAPGFGPEPYEPAAYQATPSYQPPAYEPSSVESTPAYQPPAYDLSLQSTSTYEPPSYQPTSVESTPTIEPPAEAPAFEPPPFEPAVAPPEAFEPTPFEPAPFEPAVAPPEPFEPAVDPLASFGAPPPALDPDDVPPLPPATSLEDFGLGSLDVNPPSAPRRDDPLPPPPPPAERRVVDATPATQAAQAAGEDQLPEPPRRPAAGDVPPAPIRPRTPTRIPAAKAGNTKEGDAKAMLARIAALRSDKDD